MKIDNKLFDELTAIAKTSESLRHNFDLRDKEEDNSQRMLNALEPGTIIPIHRHRFSSETVVCMRGHLKELLYDENGEHISEVVDLVAGGDCCALNIPIGVWHTIQVWESGTVILEFKEGRYMPLEKDDIKG